MAKRKDNTPQVPVKPGTTMCRNVGHATHAVAAMTLPQFLKDGLETGLYKSYEESEDPTRENVIKEAYEMCCKDAGVEPRYTGEGS